MDIDVKCILVLLLRNQFWKYWNMEVIQRFEIKNFEYADRLNKKQREIEKMLRVLGAFP